MRKNSPDRTRVFLPGGSNSTNPFPHGSRSHRSQSQVLWAWFLLRRERKSASCCSIFSAGPPADAGLQLHLSHLCLHGHMIVSPCESPCEWVYIEGTLPFVCPAQSLALQLSNPLYCCHCEALFANTATHRWGLALWHSRVAQNKAFISPGEFHRRNLLSLRRTPPPTWLFSK